MGKVYLRRATVIMRSEGALWQLPLLTRIKFVPFSNELVLTRVTEETAIKAIGHRRACSFQSSREQKRNRA
jgi:hypothetical protein